MFLTDLSARRRYSGFMKWILPLVFALPVWALAEVAQEEDGIKNAPLWELGLGGGGTYTPDYPGADQSHLWGIPFPWGVYRGEILHSDRRGATRARLFQSASYEFNVSAAGGLPSNSSQSDIREGMPNLEWLGEIGPRLMVDLISYPQRSLLRLGLPLRFAFSTNGEHTRDHGWLIAPELLYDLPNIFGSRWDAFTLLTVNFSDRRFADYFYEVEPAYAQPGRPAYSARGGYLMSDLSFGVGTPVLDSDVRLFAFGSVDSLHGSANEASPLLRAHWNASVSLVLIWVFAKSSSRVRMED
jgi:outer membrane scaffolding protein for murein synthesis (MipA/OmpV family)